MNQYELVQAVKCSLPGVTTSVVQELDLGMLDKTQLARLIGACERGYMPYGGYASALLKICAAHLGVEPPIRAYVQNWGRWCYTPVPKDVPRAVVDELMKLSDVKAAIGFKPSLEVWGQKEPDKSVFTPQYAGRELRLAGWDRSEQQAVRQLLVQKFTEASPQFREGLVRLREFVESRPKFVYTHERVAS